MRNWRRVAFCSLFLAVGPMVLTGCTLESFIPKKGKTTDVQDRQQELSREDFDDLNKIDKLIPEDAKATAALGGVAGAPPVPDLAQVLAAPQPPKIGNAKLVTLSVTDDVPLRDVLFELGRLADVDIEVGPGLDTQGINLRATNRPFNEVIERIATLGNLRYSTQGNSIRVERDTPYIKNYQLDFLNTVRSSTGSYTLSTSILSGSSGGGSSGGSSSGSSSSSSSSGSGSGTTGGNVGTSGSSASISTQADSDLWTSLEASITEILNYNPSGQAAEAGQAGPAGSTGAAAGAGFTINRQASVLSVNATQRQHEIIDRYLTLLGRNASAQVLIEAKIVEVSLSERFNSGVDWNKIIGNVNGAFLSPGTYGPLKGIEAAAGNAPTVFGVDSLGLDFMVSLAEQFGTTRTLSSPRLSAINNQQAVLTFARNEVFYDCEVSEPETTSGDNPVTTQPVPDCTPNSVPIGVILNILPSINLDTQEVTLNVRPTLTRKVGDAVNPETNYINTLGNSTADAITITTPIVEVRELDSIMKVKSGGIMVIGGLMEDTSNSNIDGVPGAADIPIVGNLFKARDETYGKRELIILMKATIVNSDGSVGPVDRAVYKKYITDPRSPF